MKHELKVLPAYFEASDGSLINPNKVRRVDVCQSMPKHKVRFLFDGWSIDVLCENMDDAQKEMGNFQQFILKSNS